MNKTSSKFQLAPLRSLDDFLLESAHFQIPNFKDIEKWGNRMVNNLLYYQTNYFLIFLSIFIIVGILHPVKIICGFLVTFLLLIIFFYITNERYAAAQFKKKHPIISLLLVLGGCYFIAYMMKSLLVFMFGILLPLSAIFIHSSLRLRNLKNKIVNRVEGLGLRRTPMGTFLAEMGMESELF